MNDITIMKALMQYDIKPLGMIDIDGNTHPPDGGSSRINKEVDTVDAIVQDVCVMTGYRLQRIQEDF